MNHSCANCYNPIERHRLGVEILCIPCEQAWFIKFAEAIKLQLEKLKQ